MRYYDFHLHSCLSPCADEDMTPNNIVNMALLIGLQAISVTDHNSLKQQLAVKACADRAQLDYLFGVELQTREEVHLLAYFHEVKEIELFQQWIDAHTINLLNNIQYFGHQTIMNEADEIIEEEKILLLNSLDADCKECVEVIHHHHGKAVLAHALGRGNGIITQLGFIPPDLGMDGIEVTDLKQIAIIQKNSPWIKETLWLCSSDAHQLVDIHECEYSISEKEWSFLKGVIL